MVLHLFLLSFRQGFTQSMADTSLFVRNYNGSTLVLLVYVDDILLTGDNTEAVQELIHAMQSVFTMKDLGFPHLFLGIQIIKCSAGLLLSQSHYAAQLLEKASLQGCNPCSTPMVHHNPPTPDDSLFPDVHLYRSLAGSLLYLTLTRPEISFAVNWICQYMHSPLHSHFTALKRILRYLNGCLHEGLLLVPGSIALTGFADSDWAGDKLDRKSTTGFCMFLGANLISWCAKKQPTVARSSTEAEYKALANAAAEMLWLTQLLNDLHVSLPSTPLIWSDNLGAIALASNPVFHARTKHVEVDYHFIREKIQLKLLTVDYIPSDQQLADLFTKALNSPQFLSLKSQLPLSSSVPRCLPAGHHLEGGCEDNNTSNGVTGATAAATTTNADADISVGAAAVDGIAAADVAAVTNQPHTFMVQPMVQLKQSHILATPQSSAEVQGLNHKEHEA